MNRRWKKFLSVIPNSNIIVFESSPDFSDNTYFLFRYLVRNNIQDQFKLVWLVSEENKDVTELCGVAVKCIPFYSEKKIDKIKKYMYILRANFIIDCNQYIHKMKNNQCRIHLTHGMPIKKCHSYFSGIGECDLLPVMGDEFQSIFSNYVDERAIKVMGLPRNDRLLKATVRERTTKNIIWMPTYRQHKNHASVDNNTRNIFPLGIPVIKCNEDLEKLNNKLRQENINLYLRIHPAQDLSVLKIKEFSNIKLADDDFLKKHHITLYGFIGECDALITDYSSIYFDYLLLDRPIGLTFEDIEEYKDSVGFYDEKFGDKAVGCKINSMSDLISFINDVKYNANELTREYRIYREKYNIHRHNTCKEIYKFMKTHIRR